MCVCRGGGIQDSSVSCTLKLITTCIFNKPRIYLGINTEINLEGNHQHLMWYILNNFMIIFTIIVIIKHGIPKSALSKTMTFQRVDYISVYQFTLYSYMIYRPWMYRLNQIVYAYDTLYHIIYIIYHEPWWCSG